MATIYQGEASGDAVNTFIQEKLGPAVDQVEKAVVIASLLKVVILVMKGDLTEEELLEGIQGASGWICTFLSAIDDRQHVEAGGTIILAN